MLLDNTYGLHVIVLIVFFKQNMNLKIQMLAGKETKAYFEKLD